LKNCEIYVLAPLFACFSLIPEKTMRSTVILLFLFFSGFALGAHAHEIQLTIYDDGISCPGGCDAHVVLNAADNGTAHAFAPGSTAQNPRKCANGQSCNICFGHSSPSCMVAIYRGGGPPSGKFDFTPAFYAKFCGAGDIPAALRRQCSALDAAVTQLGYGTRVDCFANPDDPLCVETIARARLAYDADVPERTRCLELGETPYNNQQSVPEKRRALACNYSFLRLGGPNSAGVTWRRLMPAACRPGTFVGRDGLDCCSGDKRFAASIHPECTAFFPKRN
jgi:hypothetical protein